MRKSIFVLSGIIALTSLGCSQINNDKLYKGRSLDIAIIGEVVKINNDRIDFVNMELSDLDNIEKIKDKDAIFITKDNLDKASERQYVELYRKIEKPIFFIDNIKGHIPFTNTEVLYKDVPKIEDGSYATGLRFKEDEFKFCGYGLYNDIENEKNIIDIYFRIFNDISDDVYNTI